MQILVQVFFEMGYPFNSYGYQTNNKGILFERVHGVLGFEILY